MKLSHMLTVAGLLLGASAPVLAQPGAVVGHHTVVTQRTVVVRHEARGPRAHAVRDRRHCRTVLEHHHRVQRCTR